MTTNVADRKNGVLATDSRWSGEFTNDPDSIAILDDTGFDKLITRPGISCLCAGDAPLIGPWKKWFLKDNPSPFPPPTSLPHPHSGVLLAMCAIMVCHEEGTLHCFGGDSSFIPYAPYAMFAGTGSHYARDCYAKNFSAVQSIQSAGFADCFTGGTTLFLDMKTGANNLSTHAITCEELLTRFYAEASIMNKHTRNVESIAQYKLRKADSPSALSGLTVRAPTNFQLREWSEKERSDAGALLAKAVASENGKTEK